MKSLALTLLAAIAVTAATGCGMIGAHHGKAGCASGRCQAAGTGHAAGGPIAGIKAAKQMDIANQTGMIGPNGPPTGHVSYPYYTVRGPRDFFHKEEFSTIGR